MRKQASRKILLLLLLRLDIIVHPPYLKLLWQLLIDFLIDSSTILIRHGQLPLLILFCQIKAVNWERKL